MLGLVAIVTAPNGATADLSVVVHASLPYLAPDAADAEAAVLAWCTGEIDESVVAGRGYTFTAVDVRLSARDGDWPTDLEIALLPTPSPEVGSSLAVVGDATQVNASYYPDFDGINLPHCSQPALLAGLGSATAYLGIPNDISGVDAEPFTAWTLHDFGVSAHLPGDLGESDVVFSACTSAITPLGEEFGAPNDTWHESAEPTLCSAGGSTFTASSPG